MPRDTARAAVLFIDFQHDVPGEGGDTNGVMGDDASDGDMVDLGSRVSVLKDRCASADPARHETALGIPAPLAEVVTAAELLGA